MLPDLSPLVDAIAHRAQVVQDICLPRTPYEVEALAFLQASVGPRLVVLARASTTLPAVRYADVLRTLRWYIRDLDHWSDVCAGPPVPDWEAHARVGGTQPTEADSACVQDALDLTAQAATLNEWGFEPAADVLRQLASIRSGQHCPESGSTHEYYSACDVYGVQLPPAPKVFGLTSRLGGLLAELYQWEPLGCVAYGDQDLTPTCLVGLPAIPRPSRRAAERATATASLERIVTREWSIWGTPVAWIHVEGSTAPTDAALEAFVTLARPCGSGAAERVASWVAWREESLGRDDACVATAASEALHGLAWGVIALNFD